MAIKACNFLHDVDALFTDGNFDVTKYNAFTACHSYCPYENRDPRPCKNNYERINAVGAYLYNKLVSIANEFKGEGDNGNRHIEIFIMWLGDKLFKIDNDYKATLEESYKKNLEDHTGNFKYWNVIGSKRAYKESNVSYISELYTLLNCICNLITEYKKNPNSRQIETNSNTCYQKFKNIYDKVKECYSYFHLLKNLKDIYDGFRNTAIKNASTRNTPTHSPNNRFKMMALKYIMTASKVPLIDLTTSDWKTRFKDASDQTTDFNTQKCVELRSKIEKKHEKHTSKVQQKASLPSGSDQSGGKVDKKAPEHSKLAKDPKSAKNPKFKRAENPSTPKKKVRQQRKRPQPNSKPSQAKTQTQQSLSPANPLEKQQKPAPPQPQPEPLPSAPLPQKQDPQSLQNPPEQSTDDHQKTSPPSGSEPTLGNGQEGSDKSLNVSSKEQVDSGNIKLQNILNNAKNTFEMYSSTFYGTYTDIRKRLNESMLSALKNAHTNYIDIVNKVNKVIEHVSEQLPKHSRPGKEQKTQPDHKKPESKTPSSSSTDPPTPNLPPKNSPTQNPPTQNPPTQNPPTQNPPPQNPQTPDASLKNHKGVSINSNTLMINPVTDTGIKGRIQKVIYLGNIFKGEIPIYVKAIVILIPITLAIMYKYLSFGWRKELKRKKKMKKVTNSIGGKRPMQIIIKSVNTKKMTSPVINTVRGENKLLLNIYKLMQADPVPFINLFFLLIFFVYKRKDDFLEL
ncbi:CIR protein [Plasmodium chabaudi adami]|uniref:CIR protein n=1 Tax=Plasmodium chabaudi adami TaxID=5826 RepID=A0A1D3LA07_PLACE|nr:CIR protein [Plasmodium chabaudi adami]